MSDHSVDKSSILNLTWGHDRKWRSVDVKMVVGVSLLHFLYVFAPFTFSWLAFWVAIGLLWVTGLFGITLAYHRNLSHCSFNLPKWLEYLFAYCGVLAVQRDLISIVTIISLLIRKRIHTALKKVLV